MNRVAPSHAVTRLFQRGGPAEHPPGRTRGSSGWVQKRPWPLQAPGMGINGFLQDGARCVGSAGKQLTQRSRPREPRLFLGLM